MAVQLLGELVLACFYYLLAIPNTKHVQLAAVVSAVLYDIPLKTQQMVKKKKVCFKVCFLNLKKNWGDVKQVGGCEVELEICQQMFFPL